jgi:hypothetical protein
VKDQSQQSIEQSKAKRKRPARPPNPRVDARRPAHCANCGAASRPLGGRVQLQGHGCRDRVQLGPQQPGALPQARTVSVQRYLCILCGATVQIPPKGVLRRRLYSSTAIALALGLFGLLGQTHDQVRDAIAVGGVARDPAEQQRWASLARWSRDAREGDLLDGTGPVAGTLRDAAARVALCIEGHGARVEGRLERIFSGALEAPWRGTS